MRTGTVVIGMRDVGSGLQFGQGGTHVIGCLRPLIVRRLLRRRRLAAPLDVQLADPGIDLGEEVFDVRIEVAHLCDRVLQYFAIHLEVAALMSRLPELWPICGVTAPIARALAASWSA